MRSVKVLFSVIVAALAVFSFSNNCQAQSSQGIAGEVVWKSGDHMPTVGGKSSGTTKNVSREIVVYKLVKQSDVKGNGPLYEAVTGKKIASAKSTKNGKYSIRLAPGKYSVFVKEKGKLFASMSDGDGNINPVEVMKGKMTKMNITVDYEAAY